VTAHAINSNNGGWGKIIAINGGNMAAWQFWVFVALIVVGEFQMMRSIDEGADSIRRKIDDLISELKAVNSKLDRP
jgi:hypothetical protein